MGRNTQRLPLKGGSASISNVHVGSFLLSLTTNVFSNLSNVDYCPQRSCGKVMCLHLSVYHSVHRGSVCHTPSADTPPGQTPPGQTPPEQTPPSGHTPTLGHTHPWGTHPPSTHPLSSACWDRINKWAVHILLECMLVTALCLIFRLSTNLHFKFSHRPRI